MQVAFEVEIIHTQYCVQNKRLDFYFPKPKLGIEIGEYGHVDRSFEDEQSRQLMVEEKPGCKTITTDPDAADFNIYRLNIEQSAIKTTKNSLINDLSKDLLEAAIKLKSKCRKERLQIEHITFLMT